MNNKKYDIEKDFVVKLFGGIILVTFLCYVVLGTLIEEFKKERYYFVFFVLFLFCK
ncbi:MAG: hypothetical protein WDA21_02295 [Bacilli bacterium]